MKQQHTNQPLIIHGPQGCGKTRHAKALAMHFGKSNVVDDYCPGMKLDERDLALTHESVSGPNTMHFSDAARIAGIASRP